MSNGGVRFGPPAIDPAPFLAAGMVIPCNLCAHDLSEHDYLYTLGAVDLYRCRASACPCGAKSEVRGVALAGNPTEAEVEAAMATLAAGGGERIPVSVRTVR